MFTQCIAINNNAFLTDLVVSLRKALNEFVIENCIALINISTQMMRHIINFSYLKKTHDSYGYFILDIFYNLVYLFSLLKRNSKIFSIKGRSDAQVVPSRADLTVSLKLPIKIATWMQFYSLWFCVYSMYFMCSYLCCKTPSAMHQSRQHKNKHENNKQFHEQSAEM